MTFEFDYNTDTEEITIVYDGTYVLKASFDGDRIIFKNFEKIGDDDIEQLLKSFCRSAVNVLN
jgi:hypothetical protein